MLSSVVVCKQLLCRKVNCEEQRLFGLSTTKFTLKRNARTRTTQEIVFVNNMNDDDNSESTPSLQILCLQISGKQKKNTKTRTHAKKKELKKLSIDGNANKKSLICEHLYCFG